MTTNTAEDDERARRGGSLKCWEIFSECSWIFKIVEGDLFSAPEKYALAHCVAVDMHMGAGIAVKFREKFGRVTLLEAQNPKVGSIAVLNVDNRTVYYLVTKKLSSQKPKYADLLRSLLAMRKHMRANGVRQLAIPKIGCGLDRLEWERVLDLLYRTFHTEAVEIVLYEYSNGMR